MCVCGSFFFFHYFPTVKAVNRMKTKQPLSRTEYIDSISKYPKTVEARYELSEILGKGGYAIGK